MLLFRLADRSLGLLSTIVLARLLVPEDFGLVAMAMSIIALVELASSFGFETVLIQKADPTRAHYDTAWTLNLLFGFGCAALMAALAMPAAGFYSEPRLVPVVCVIALGWAIQGAENIGVVDFRRAMDFRREFLFLAQKRVAAFVATVALALVLRSYWALVLGALAGRVAGTLASYAMSDYRPRLSLSVRSELFRFSTWLLVANVVAFAETRFAHFFVGKVQGPGPLGLFTVGSDLASMATTEVSAPINRAAFAGYSRLAGAPEQLCAEVTTVIGMIALITLPLTAALIGLAEPLVAMVLGGSWLPVVPILQILVVAACARSIMSNYHSVFVALGRPHLTPVLEGCRVALMVPLTLAWSDLLGLQGVALAQAASIGVGFVVSSVVFMRVLKLSAARWIGPIARPALASIVMLAGLHMAVSPLRRSGAGNELQQVLVGVCVGAVVYSAVLAGLWLLAGRPPGAEAALLRLMARPFARSSASTGHRDRS